MSLAIALAALLAPIPIGALLGALRFFPDPEAATDAINRVALHVAFPALVVVALARAEAAPTEHLALVAIVVLSLAIASLIVRLVARAVGHPNEAGSIALVVTFGNVAYIGLPFVAAVLGAEALAPAALAVSAHVAVAVTAGPLLLARWSEGANGADAPSIARIAKQPLIWAPLAGLGMRLIPRVATEPVLEILDPLGKLAAPLSMLLLGLYLWLHRGALRLDARVVAHCAARLVLVPLVTAPLALFALARGWVDVVELRVLLVLAAMPAAITTFTMALEQESRSHRSRVVAAAVVVSVLAACVTLPVVTALALRLR